MPKREGTRSPRPSVKDKEHSVSSVDDYDVSLDAIRLGTIALEPSVSQRAFLRETLGARRARGDAEGTARDLQGAPPARLRASQPAPGAA